MGKLIMPKHTADMDYIMSAMKIYYDSSGWVSMSDYKNRLFAHLKAIKKESQRNSDETHYTKCSEIPRYFGWLERKNPGNKYSDVRITQSGLSFFESVRDNDSNTTIELIVSALENVVFGRNNEGCGSDTDIEAPCVMVKSMLLLDGINNKELAHILSDLNDKQIDFENALLTIKYYRESGEKLPDSSITSDIKFVSFLRNVGFLEETSRGVTALSPATKSLYYKRLIDLPITNSDETVFEERSTEENNRILNDLEISSEMKNYITALKTKPFLLLAGISGTGKSQKVKELAYMTCPNSNHLQDDKNTPGNYCLIEVKPNWHDSTELLGYFSNLTQKYNITPFLNFVYKAAHNPTVPFFVCLDEMNLAPVEQYFAEYLSVLETRSVQGDKIVSAELLSKKQFEGYPEVKEYTDSELEVLRDLKENGLRLPENLFVVGTVNMDDTTHQFSRKVIDRAFTIEMNGDELSEMFKEDNEKSLEYAAEPLPLKALKPKYVRASDALKDEKIAPFKDTIIKEVPAKLGAFNAILKNTPFRVSYRVQNELVLYLSTLILNAGDVTDIKPLIDEATLVILLEKILPRVQGDEKLLNTDKGNVFKSLKELISTDKAKENKNGLYTEVCAKLDEMDNRLNNTYFANFF